MTNQMFLPARASIKAADLQGSQIGIAFDNTFYCRPNPAHCPSTYNYGYTNMWENHCCSVCRTAFRMRTERVISALLFFGKEQIKPNRSMAKEIHSQQSSIGLLGPRKHFFCPKVFRELLKLSSPGCMNSKGKIFYSQLKLTQNT